MSSPKEIKKKVKESKENAMEEMNKIEELETENVVL